MFYFCCLQIDRLCEWGYPASLVYQVPTKGVVTYGSRLLTDVLAEFTHLISDDTPTPEEIHPRQGRVLPSVDTPVESMKTPQLRALLRNVVRAELGCMTKQVIE